MFILYILYVYFIYIYLCKFIVTGFFWMIMARRFSLMMQRAAKSHNGNSSQSHAVQITQHCDNIQWRQLIKNDATDSRLTMDPIRQAHEEAKQALDELKLKD